MVKWKEGTIQYIVDLVSISIKKLIVLQAAKMQWITHELRLQGDIKFNVGTVYFRLDAQFFSNILIVF